MNDRLKHAAAEPRAQWMRANAARYFAYFQREPRLGTGHMAPVALARHRQRRVFLAIVAATDDRHRRPGRHLGAERSEWPASVPRFRSPTSAKSFWSRYRARACARRALPPSPRRRFLARPSGCGRDRGTGPGLAAGNRSSWPFFSIAKRLIGRARPRRKGSTGLFSDYRPLGWSVEYAKPPVGSFDRRIRGGNGYRCPVAVDPAFMWTYAVVIALSRVVLTAHFPSDVMVWRRRWRRWRAAGARLDSRRAGSPSCSVRGTVRPLPGAFVFARIKRVAGQLTAHKKLAPSEGRERLSRGHIGHIMNETLASAARRPFRHRSGTEQGRHDSRLIGGDRQRTRRRSQLRGHLCQRRFERSTEAESTQLMASRPWLRHKSRPGSCGQSAAVPTGVLHARADDRRRLSMATARTTRPSFRHCFDARCCGSPAGGPCRRTAGWPPSHRLQKVPVAAGQWACAAPCCGTSTRDTGCGLKAFRRDLFLALPYFDGLHRFLPALARREGYDVAYVDVVDRPRHAGTSNYGMWDRLWIGILDLMGVWWLIRRRRRVPQVQEVKRNAD